MSKVERVRLGEVWKKAPKSKLSVGALKEMAEQSPGNIIAFTSGEKCYFVNEALADGEYIFMNDGGAADTKYNNGKAAYSDHIFCYTIKDKAIILVKYLYYFLKEKQAEIDINLFQGVGLKNLNKRAVAELLIPLPPVEKQKEIIAILDKFTTLAEALAAEKRLRVKQYNYYRDTLLTFTENTEFKPVSEIFNIRNGYTPSKANKDYWEGGVVPWFRMDDIRANGHILSQSLQMVSESAIKGNKLFPANSIIIATSATIGEHALIEVPHLSNQRFTSLSLKEKFVKRLNMRFVFYYCFILDEWCKNNIAISSFASVDMAGFRKFKFPLPPLAEQKRIVAILDKFDSYTNSISQGLPAEIAARQKQYEYYRHKLLSFE